MTDAGPSPIIVRGENDRLFDSEGRSYIDLFSAHGTAWLGHANPAVGEAITRQLREVWNTGAISTPIREQAREAVEAFFPDAHRLAGFYSTGMEAAEFALRMARIHTGRRRLIGFEHAMHGKSLATAALGWDNDWNLGSTDLVRLRFVDAMHEYRLTPRLERELSLRDVAAVIVEPIQASHGGYEATRDFYQSLHKLCVETGTLLVFDEILTGLWRTGEPFYFRGQGLRPDVVLIGKGLGGGFPVSAVAVDQNIAIEPRMLPTSTFAGNSLAAAAVAAALGEMRRLELPARVAAIAMCVRESLDPLAQHGVALRGRGALWVLEMPAGVDMPRLLKDVYEHGVAIGGAGRFIRLLPAATIVPENLRQACEVLSNAILRQLAERHA